MVTYQFIVFIHIAAATLLLATSIVGEPMVRAAVRRATTAPELRAYLALGRPASIISPIAALVLLGSGVLLTSLARFWVMGWIQVATAFWIVNSALAMAVVRPAMDRITADAKAAADLAIGPRLDDARWSRAWTLGTDVMAANDAAMLYLMTMKPGLAGSLAAVLLANVVVGAGRVALGATRTGVARAQARPGVS